MADQWLFTEATGFTLSSTGTGAEIARIDHRPMTAACEIVLSLNSTADAVSILMFASKDGRTRWRFYADATKLWARRAVFGVEEAAIDLGNHTVPAGVPYTLAARLTGNVVRVTITAGGYDEAEGSTTLDDELIDLNRWGFSSALNGARVLRGALYQLVPVQATRAEVLLVVCGGLLYVCDDQDGVLLFQVPGRVAGTLGQVGIAEWEGQGLIVGGGLASVYDPITKTLTAWYDDEHSWNGGDFSTLPGATPPVSGDDTKGRGTTGATIIEVHNNRVVLSGWSERPEVVFESAADDRNSFRLNNVELGEAGSFTVNAHDTVTCLLSLPSSNLLIGCKTQMRMQLGDPLYGQITVPQVSDSGVSGPRASVKNDVGLAAVHSPDGLFNVPQLTQVGSSLPDNITSGVLTEGIQIPQDDIGDYVVHLTRNPSEHLLYIFISPVVEGSAFHFVYDERMGRYRKDAGFLFPEQFPTPVGPTASILWRGEVLLGTRNGLVLTYQDGLKTDRIAFTGGTTTQNIESWMFLVLTADAHPVGDTIVTSWRALLSDASDPVLLQIFGGATAETLFDFVRNRQLFSCTIEPFGPPFIEQVRAPAIAMFIHNSGDAPAYFELEQVVGNFEVGRTISEARNLAPDEPARPGRPPRIPAADTGDPDDGGAGPGDGTNPPGDGYGGGTPPGGGGSSEM